MRITHIQKLYTTKIPIVLIYKTIEEKQNYENFLLDFSVSDNFEDHYSCDILLVNLLETKGKEFPVVVCNIDDLNDHELYLIMTRAQFELDLLTQKNTLENPKLEELYKSNWFELNGIVANDNNISLSSNKHYDESKILITDIPINSENNTSISNEHQAGAKLVINYNTKVDHQPASILEPSIISDNNTYKEAYRKKREDQLYTLAQRSQALSNTTKTIIDKEKISKIGAEETKDFFRRKDQYAGHCQICGFSFKTKKNHYYFERFTWTDYTKGKWSREQKELLTHKIIDAGNSLCLCAKCHSVIKQGGDFEALFLNDIFDRIKSLSDEDILESIQSKKLTQVPDIYRDHIEFNDMYALPIRLLGTEQNLYFTEIHLIQFIEFLKS